MRMSAKARASVKHHSIRRNKMSWNEEYKKKTVSFEEAARQIRSGDFVGVARA